MKIYKIIPKYLRRSYSDLFNLRIMHELTFWEAYEISLKIMINYQC
jgi:hypothetical protein